VAAAKALAYGPDLAESHNAIAQVSLLFDWDWARTERSFMRALEAEALARRDPSLVVFGRSFNTRALG